MPSLPERRRLTRVPAAIDAVLTDPQGGAHAARLENLSIIGLHALVAEPLAAGTRCLVALRADGDSVEARGVVVRAQGRAVAVGFDELPFESYERLRAFLLRHAHDPAVIAEELSERLGYLGESA